MESKKADLALKVNSASFNGDMYQLRGLIRAGVDPNKEDYDGRSPLVMLATVGSSGLRIIKKGGWIN